MRLDTEWDTGRMRQETGDSMIEIKAAGNGILLKTLERSKLAAVAELYNCSRDIRYATGIKDSVSYMEIDKRLFKTENNKFEFLTGIYIQNSNLTEAGIKTQLTGLISGVMRNKTVWIKTIAVLPEYRRKGIGSRSANLLLQYFKTGFGVSEAFLSVIRENSAGVLFWLNQGFSQIFRFRKKLFDMEKQYEVIIMQKRL